MRKQYYQKYISQQRELNKNKVCQYCGNEHDHTYGTGLFCSKKCKDLYIGSKNKGSYQKMIKYKTIQIIYINLDVQNMGDGNVKYVIWFLTHENN